MLRKIEDQIKNCLDHAAKARRWAEETADPARKAEYHFLELSWIRLACSYEFEHSLKTFLRKPSSVNTSVWHHLILETYSSLTREIASEKVADRRIGSLGRHGPYEVRLVELSRIPQEGTEHLWLELFDHDQQCTIDSYGGRTLVDVTAAAESLCSKAKILERQVQARDVEKGRPPEERMRRLRHM